MKEFLFIYFGCMILYSCNAQVNGPGYSFSLFENTPIKALANAVEKDDTIEIKKLLKDKNVNINLQEPILGRTILLLAIGNDRLLSTKVLLESGANVAIRDSDDIAAIHEATQYIAFKKNTYEILKLLLKHGADINSISHGNSANTGNYYTPLQGAVSNLKCAKFLIENGANLYFKPTYKYVVWFDLLSNSIDENIYSAKYIIIEKKIPVPEIISKTIKGKPIDIISLLNDDNFPIDPMKRKARQEILDYLMRIEFPKHGVYTEK